LVGGVSLGIDLCIGIGVTIDIQVAIGIAVRVPITIAIPDLAHYSSRAAIIITVEKAITIVVSAIAAFAGLIAFKFLDGLIMAPCQACKGCQGQRA
jgi:hypothetical protein